MRRTLAPLAAALALSAPAARAGEPLDLDITRLGAPSAAAWLNAGGGAITQAEADLLATDARTRFALLSSQLALALSSALLEPAATVGHSGFAFDLEAAYTTVNHAAVGSAPFAGAFPRDAWPVRGSAPSALLVPSFHVRKALFFSFELGGRLLYLSQSSYFAAQLQGKWAIQEGYARIPDVALLVNHTALLGQKAFSLSSTDLALMTSKRFGVNAVMSLTPYLAARYLLVRAGSDALAYLAPGAAAGTAPDAAAFPALHRALYRTTLGLRMTAYATTMAAELTWFAGARSAASGGYAAYTVPSSFSGAFKLGFEF
jgi:hypothetical protein